jgi:hypothetical protein
MRESYTTGFVELATNDEGALEFGIRNDVAVKIGEIEFCGPPARGVTLSYCCARKSEHKQNSETDYYPSHGSLLAEEMHVLSHCSRRPRI